MNVESKKGKDARSPRIFTNLSRINTRDLEQSAIEFTHKFHIFKGNNEIAQQSNKSCSSYKRFYRQVNFAFVFSAI
jgi:hypothetical protein